MRRWLHTRAAVIQALLGLSLVSVGVSWWLASPGPGLALAGVCLLIDYGIGTTRRTG